MMPRFAMVNGRVDITFKNKEERYLFDAATAILQGRYSSLLNGESMDSRANEGKQLMVEQLGLKKEILAALEIRRLELLQAQQRSDDLAKLIERDPSAEQKLLEEARKFVKETREDFENKITDDKERKYLKSQTQHLYEDPINRNSDKYRYIRLGYAIVKDGAEFFWEPTDDGRKLALIRGLRASVLVCGNYDDQAYGVLRMQAKFRPAITNIEVLGEIGRSGTSFNFLAGTGPSKIDMGALRDANEDLLLIAFPGSVGLQALVKGSLGTAAKTAGKDALINITFNLAFEALSEELGEGTVSIGVLAVLATLLVRRRVRFANLGKQAPKNATAPTREALARQEAQKLLETAKQSEPDITKAMQAAAGKGEAKLERLETNLKTEESLTRKIADRSTDPRYARLSPEEAVARAAANERNVNDVLRYTVVAESEAGYYKTYDAVKQSLESQGYKQVRAADFWERAGTPQEISYRGINATFQGPNGQLFEVQFHTKSSLATSGRTHVLYEEARAASTTPARKQEIEAEMKKIWDSITRPNR